MHMIYEETGKGSRVEVNKENGKKMVLGGVKLQPDPMGCSGHKFHC